jgi:hypothetical protein
MERSASFSASFVIEESPASSAARRRSVSEA